MTLILACLTADRIVVAADRRLTLPDGTLFDDDTTKAIYYCGRCAIAYTGLARIGTEDTATWIARQLVDEPQLEPALGKMATALEGSFGPHPTQAQRLAILAFGWATYRGQPPARPFGCVLSNFFDPARGWLNDPKPCFSLDIEFLSEPRKSMILVAGQSLHPADVTWLTRRTRSCVERSTGPAPYAYFLGETIRALAAVDDARGRRVGRALIIQALSRIAVVNGRGTQLVTPLAPDANSFLYMAADGSVDRFQGPILVCGGMMLTGIGGGTIPPGQPSIFQRARGPSGR